MRIQPRQQILEIWRALAQASYSDGRWQWGGGPESNPISDAEQLLCLLLPATRMPGFALADPERTDLEVLRALDVVGDQVEIPLALVHALREYFEKYDHDELGPDFGGGGYLVVAEGDDPSTEEQWHLAVVESFAVSIMLCLDALAFVRSFRSAASRPELRALIDRVDVLAGRRLTAALVGLLRSFAVHVFDADSPPGRLVCRAVNQDRLSTHRVIGELRSELRATIAGLHELSIGSGDATDVDGPSRLFECGWSWGVVRDAPEIALAEGPATPRGRQPEGIATPTPYLYFTVVALDAIEEVSSVRTRVLGLLDEEQQRLNRALELRRDLTRSYWTTVAGFGDGQWPLEDMPWRTTDGEESDHLSLLVTALFVEGLADRRAADAELGRVADILVELAHTGRITRRPFEDDPQLRLHAPGVPLGLTGSELSGPRLAWIMSDYSPALLRRTLRLAELASDVALRTRLLDLADQVWDHVWRRRIEPGGGWELWDDPARVYPDLADKSPARPTWGYTERVVRCLVDAGGVAERAAWNAGLGAAAADLLAEAEHLFDQEQMVGSSTAGPSLSRSLGEIRGSLLRARAMLRRRPGTASALAYQVVEELDRLRAARADVAERRLDHE